MGLGKAKVVNQDIGLEFTLSEFLEYTDASDLIG
jgi:hypothetical protein